MTMRDRGAVRGVTAALVAVTALGLAGCNRDDPIPADGEFMGNSAPATEGTPQEEDTVAYQGQYNQEFYDEAANYAGQQVMVSGEVSRTLSPDSFTIGGPADPMLVIEEEEIPSVSEGQTVEITGTVRESFSVTEVEEQLGIDLEDAMYTDFEGEPYVMATGAGSAGEE